MENYTTEIIELTQQLLEGNDTIKELKEKLDYMIKTNDKFKKLEELIKDGELDLEYYDFIMRLAAHDEELFSQIEKLKKSKSIKHHQDSLERMKIKLNEANKTLGTQVNNLGNSAKPKTNLPIIKQIQQQKIRRENKEILKTKLDLIIETLKNNRQTLMVIDPQDKKIEEEYSKKYEIKLLYDGLYKLCEGTDTSEINRIYQELNKKYNTVAKEIDRDIEKAINDYKNNKKETDKFDQRLRDYIFKGQDNLTTYMINNAAPKGIINYSRDNETVVIEIQNNSQAGIIIYSLIALYHIYSKKKNSKINMTFVEKILPKNTSISKSSVSNSSVKFVKENPTAENPKVKIIK